MKADKAILGVLGGVAVGALIGVLFAPEKGCETRKKIAEKGKDSLDNLKDKYNEAIDTLAAKLETAKKAGLNYYEEGQDVAENAKDQFQNVIK